MGDYATKGVIGNHATFSLSSKTTDLDEKFTEILGSMDLDTAGGLVEVLSRQGKWTQRCQGTDFECSRFSLEFLQVVIAPWKDFALDWVTRCSTDGEGESSMVLKSTSSPEHALQWTGFSSVGRSRRS